MIPTVMDKIKEVIKCATPKSHIVVYKDTDLFDFKNKTMMGLELSESGLSFELYEIVSSAISTNQSIQNDNDSKSFKIQEEQVIYSIIRNAIYRLDGFLPSQKRKRIKNRTSFQLVRDYVRKNNGDNSHELDNLILTIHESFFNKELTVENLMKVCEMVNNKYMGDKNAKSNR